MRVLTRLDAIKRYGPIDFSTKYWPKQREWIEMFQVHSELFPNWFVADTKMPVHHIALNRDLVEPFAHALENAVQRKQAHLLKTFDGCFNIRMVRGSNTAFSAHSYGLAIDLNCQENWLGNTHGGFYDHPEFVKCFTDAGFTWGGNFHGRKDPMHFSYCWE